MKHILKQVGVFSISMAMVFGGVVTVFAQEAVDTSVSTESDVVTAGVVPGNPAFFLDRFAEFVQDAFTFDAKAKARLRVKFADERLAEIKLVLENKDVSNRGVDRARQALARDVDRAEAFITERADELGDIKVELEQELAKNEAEFLKELSQKQSELVKAQIELRKKIEALEKGNDTDNSLPGLQSEFESIQKDILGLGEDFDEFEIEIEDEDEDESENESEDDDSQETVHDRAQQAGQRMAQAYEERAKAVERLAKEKAEGSLTAGAQSIFDAADDFLDQSERAFKSGLYVQAEYYAERAKKVFNDARSGKNFAPGQVEKESDDSSDDDDETEDSDDVDDDDDADDDSDDESDDTDDEENDDDSDDNDAEDDSDDEDEDDDSEDDDDSNSGSGNSGSDDNDD